MKKESKKMLRNTKFLFLVFQENHEERWVRGI